MDERAAAAQAIASLFGDGGAAVLNDLDLGRTWEQALESVPLPSLQIRKGVGGAPPGVLYLSRARDHWARTGQLRPAAGVTRALVRLKSQALGQEHPDTVLEIGALGALAAQAGRHDQARQLLEGAWMVLRSIAGGRDVRVAMVAEHLGASYLMTGELHEAESVFQQAYRIRKEIEPGSQHTLAARLGEILHRKGQVKEAATLMHEAWQLARDAYGPTAPVTMKRAVVLAEMLTSQERFAEAEPVLRDLYAQAMEGGKPATIAAANYELGMGLYRVQRFEEGFRHVEEAIRLTRDLGDPHPELATRLMGYSKVLLRRGYREEAEGVVREAVEVQERLTGPTSGELGVRYVELADLLDKFGRKDEAMGLLEPAVSIMADAYGANHPATQRAATDLAVHLIRKAQEALAMRDKAMAKDYQRFGEALIDVLGRNHGALKKLRDLR